MLDVKATPNTRYKPLATAANVRYTTASSREYTVSMEVDMHDSAHQFGRSRDLHHNDLLPWFCVLKGISSLALCCLLGCGDGGTTQDGSIPAGSDVVVVGADKQKTVEEAQGSGKAEPEAYGEVEFKPLSLRKLPRVTTLDSAGTAGGDSDSEEQIQTVISKLQPLQILLGQWRGTTRREFENFKAVDSHEWVWDLRTDPNRPALTISSDKSPYLKTGRLTWDVGAEKFSLVATDALGKTRNYLGDFSEPVHEIVGSDDKLHKVFRLEFNQQKLPDDADELWQLAIDQQENNRYLLEVGKRRGAADFSRFDTVSTQREGTSFAVSDTDYGEKKCIISEGLGTTEITYKGRSYWVCCSGCKAAFEEDPEKWIARASNRETGK